MLNCGNYNYLLNNEFKLLNEIPIFFIRHDQMASITPNQVSWVGFEISQPDEVGSG